jgi:hypothetical protein
MPQLVMIDDVFIAERDAENALAEQAGKLMHDQRRATRVLETVREARHQPDGVVGLAQQQRSGIRCDRAAVERAHNLATLDGSKIKRILATLCQHRGVSLVQLKSLSQNNFR